MDFELNEIQTMLSTSAADFVRRHGGVERARKLRDEDGPGWDPALWKQMGELGWLGAAFPEACGGLGGSFIEAAVILEQLGKGLAPEPLIPSLLAGLALARAGSAEQQARWLAPMIAGETSLAWAWAEKNARYSGRCQTSATPGADGSWTLSGEKTWVCNGHAADHIVVTAAHANGLGFFVIDRDTPGVTIEEARLIDGRKAARIRLDDAHLDATRALTHLPDGTLAEHLLDQLKDHGAAAAVAEGLGVAQTTLAMTLQYLGLREQFGRRIGSFQALQHRAVDMFVEVELLRSTSMAAMVRVEDPEPRVREQWVSAAKYQLATGGRQISQEAVQLHGGVGITDEHDIGLFFKRMHSLNMLFGDERYHIARFAERETSAGEGTW